VLNSPSLRNLSASILALLAIVAFARLAPPIITEGDFAVSELYTELATRGQLVVGPYSRFGWQHPGPLYFYLQAAPYALGGHAAASLYATALVINLAAILTLFWSVSRDGRSMLGVLVAVACLMFAWRAPRFLASPWTGHVPILPTLAFIALSAAVIAGRSRLLLLTVAFGAFVAQTHLGFAPVVAVLSIVAVASVAMDRKTAGRWRIIEASAVLSLLFWLPTMIEAMTSNGGNVAALWRFFVTDAGPGHTLGEAFTNWSYGLAGILRPDLEVGWGGHFTLRYLEWAVPFAIAQIALLALIAWRDLVSGERFEGTLAAAALTASCIGLWALTRVRDDILDHEIFWLAPLGAMNLAIVVSAALHGVVSRRLSTGVTVILASVAVATGVSDLRDLTGFERRRTDRPAIVATYASVARYVREAGVQRPLIEIDGSLWGHAAGVLLRLEQDRIAFAVGDGSPSMFTNVFPTNGREDAIVTIATRDRHHAAVARPGNVVVREANPVFVDAIRIAPGTVR
jgi:hypothetical protein